MAEFKLSRIRFNWKGEWTGGTIIFDDMTNYNGYTYVALRTHIPRLLQRFSRNGFNIVKPKMETIRRCCMVR